MKCIIMEVSFITQLIKLNEKKDLTYFFRKYQIIIVLEGYWIPRQKKTIYIQQQKGERIKQIRRTFMKIIDLN